MHESQEAWANLNQDLKEIHTTNTKKIQENNIPQKGI